MYLQPGYILQHRPYRESSLIIEVLTRDFGKISILAKGVRKPKSKVAALLRPFTLLSLSYLGRSELRTLTQVELVQTSPPLPGLALYCGFYINELTGHFLHKYDPHPEVFQLYQACLVQLSENSAIEPVLRNFELNLLDNVGYGLSLAFDEQHRRPVSTAKKYIFSADSGPVEALNGTVAGQTLLALHTRTLIGSETLAGAKKLMREVIDFHLQGKPLKSRAVIAKIAASLQSKDTPREVVGTDDLA